jgi:hypothetical protein
MDERREERRGSQPGEVLPGYEEPNDEMLDPEVRQRLGTAPVNVPPATDEAPAPPPARERDP